MSKKVQQKNKNIEKIFQKINFSSRVETCLLCYVTDRKRKTALMTVQSKKRQIFMETTWLLFILGLLERY